MFGCGCEAPKQLGKVALCAWAVAKGSACPDFQVEACAETSERFDFPCLGFLGCKRSEEAARVKGEGEKRAGLKRLVGRFL